MELFDYDVEITLLRKEIHADQDVFGDVIIKVQTALFLTHVYIEISGKATCSWSNGKRRARKGEEEFFYCKNTLAGNNGNEVILAKKNYYFPYKCKLPGHLPATWSGDYGYSAQVVVKAAEGELIGVHSKEIIIETYRNLVAEPYLLIESKKTVTRTFRFSFLSLGQVTVSLWLPLSGIAAGQSLPVLCNIDNQSTVQFGGIVFVLTQIQIFRSNSPKYEVKTVRKDVCRVARMVDILHGVQDFYAVLSTSASLFPTTQYWCCTTCQLVYEVWAQIQGSLPKNKAYGYPNVDIPGIPIIIGTHPICTWNINEINAEVMMNLLQIREPMQLDAPPPDIVVEEILNTVDDELDLDMMSNLTKQITVNDSSVKQNRLG